MFKTTKQLLMDDELLAAGLELLDSTPLADVPDRYPILDSIYGIAKRYEHSKYFTRINARQFIASFEAMVKRFNGEYKDEDGLCLININQGGI